MTKYHLSFQVGSNKEHTYTDDIVECIDQVRYLTGLEAHKVGTIQLQIN